MDLQELNFWLAREMREKNIPGGAILKFADVGADCELRDLELTYNRDANTVTITEIKGAQQ